ncbi:MAG: hypothetical protein ACP5OG_03150 [Candidatus Nanoarchaeia archaeon]
MAKTNFIVCIAILMLFVIPFVSAGVGIKWEKESALVKEGESTCLTYSVYNPWPKDSYVEIDISDELKNILTEQETETKLIPAQTSSMNSIPVKFCFKVPKNVYEDDCLAGNLFCKQECNLEAKTYSGEVIVKEVPAPVDLSGGAGGSTTTTSVSAPLKIRVSCEQYSRNYTILYLIIGIVSLLVIIFLVYRMKNKKIAHNPKKRRSK